jgi:hypothetical protein
MYPRRSGNSGNTSFIESFLVEISESAMITLFFGINMQNTCCHHPQRASGNRLGVLPVGPACFRPKKIVDRLWEKLYNSAEIYPFKVPAYEIIRQLGERELHSHGARESVTKQGNSSERGNQVI